MISFDFPPLTLQLLTGVCMIFALKFSSEAIRTVRVLAMMRGSKLFSAGLGFIEVLISLIAIGLVVNNLSNIWNIMSYSFGFTAGILLGLKLEEKLAFGYVCVNIFSKDKAREIVDALRGSGFGATFNWGWGRDGSIGVVMTAIHRRKVPAVNSLAEDVDPRAFLIVDEVRSIKNGIGFLAKSKG